MNFESTVIPNSEDYIHTSSLFSGIKKTVLSKDFKGGKVSNLFGSTELDFTNADLTGAAVLDISQAFGEVTIAVPRDWHVETDISQLMAVVDDYREKAFRPKQSDKVLVIKGTSLCASIEILTAD